MNLNTDEKIVEKTKNIIFLWFRAFRCLNNTLFMGNNISENKAIKNIINLSIKKTKFPSKWKVTEVKPFLKRGENKFLCKIYRPFSVLSTLSCLVKKSITAQVSKYLENKDVLPSSIPGYRKSYGCSTLLMEMLE